MRGKPPAIRFDILTLFPAIFESPLRESLLVRVIEGLPAEEVSIGDFVLAGGEVAALALVEAVARLVPGVVGNEESLTTESFEAGLLDYPHYTRPASFRGMDVPEVLLSGDHAR